MKAEARKMEKKQKLSDRALMLQWKNECHIRGCQPTSNK